MAVKRELLVVDGYNVIHGTSRYQGLIDEHAGAGALADVAHLSRDPYGHDPFDHARATLVADVAAYAQGSFDAVIVFDGAGNLSPERPDGTQAGVRVVFSRTGESADTVIERLVSEARRQGRGVRLVTSDNTIRYTVGGEPVVTISSALLASEVAGVEHDAELARAERNHGRLTVRDRLDPETRRRLDELLGR